MDVRHTINLLEQIEAVTDEHEAITNAFNMNGVGELIESTFRDAKTPQELQHGIVGMATDLHTSMKSGNYEVAKDMGFANISEIKQFMIFASGVANDPEYFFNMYQYTVNPVDELGRL